MSLPHFDERYNLWKQFLARWTPQTLSSMTLPQYHTADDPNKDNLVNWLERRTRPLGSILGGDAFKFGVYSRLNNSSEVNRSGVTLNEEYGWRNKYGSSPEEAFQTVRTLILNIVAKAQQSDMEAIQRIDFSPTVKWKLAFLYQPQDSPFMPSIYSSEMLQDILSLNKQLPMVEMYHMLMQQKGDKDILAFTDTLLAKINFEMPFKEWMTSQHQSNGKLYSANTISQYIRYLKKKKEIKDIEKEKTNIFCYTTQNVFAELRKRIVAAPNFADLNAKTNGAYAASMERYNDFLQEYVGTEATRSDESIGSTDTANTTGYTLQDITTDGCFLSLTTLERIYSHLSEKKNIILQGPPGTGKTWLAKRLAWALVGEKPSQRVQALQFHATLSYEDFVCGWRPVGEGKLELLDGPFLEALNKANEAPNTPYVLVIEEINRGNPAQIFGELLTLLEADKRKPEEALRLCYQKSGECRTVHLPANLYLIGTMNIADRSLAIVDFALRRRFAFFDLMPTFSENWQNWMREKAKLPAEFVTKLGKAMEDCNAKITNDTSLGAQYAIGHSFVTCAAPITDPHAWIEGIVAAEITPLLKEYWFNDPKKAEETAQAILAALP